MTVQAKVLSNVRKQFGPSAFTEDTINYKRVGCVKNKKVYVSIGDTWDEAIKGLNNKITVG